MKKIYEADDMKIMKNRLYALLPFMLFLVFSLFGCTSKRTFYQEGSDWDSLRFPLLEPYYAINVLPDPSESGWEINLDNKKSIQSNFRYYGAILDVRKIAVENGVIMVYSAYSEPIMLAGEKREKKPLHWFILIPGQTELGFENEAEFLYRLKDYNISQPKWQEPLPILQKFDQTRCLEWIPGCK
jgi:hypothetical protein